uniref:Putative ovule protein n=1 Tax=Solanum chacoense TaxID=4108 RepID=A0A0V0HKE0_SOLCH
MVMMRRMVFCQLHFCIYGFAQPVDWYIKIVTNLKRYMPQSKMKISLISKRSLKIVPSLVFKWRR